MKASVVSSKHLLKNLILFTAMLGLSTSAWSDKPAPVNVVNTPNVKVVNTPSVSVPNGVTVNNTSPVPVTGTVSTGPKPSDMITLLSAFSQGPCPFGSVYFVVAPSDGSFGSDMFVVPAGKVFVIESANAFTQAAAANEFVEVGVFRALIGGDKNDFSQAIRFGVLANAAGDGAASLTTPPGIVVTHDANLCAGINPRQGGDAFGTTVSVVGYLRDDQ